MIVFGRLMSFLHYGFLVEKITLSNSVSSDVYHKALFGPFYKSCSTLRSHSTLVRGPSESRAEEETTEVGIKSGTPKLGGRHKSGSINPQARLRPCTIPQNL